MGYLEGPSAKEVFMRQNHGFLLAIITLFAVPTLIGCFSSTKETKEYDTAPAPVVQVNPPAVAPLPGTQTTTTTWSNSTAVPDNTVSSTSVAPAPTTYQNTTTTWDNGAVVQRHTITEPRPGVVQKQSTTSWNDGAAAPSETTTTTTTEP